MLRPCRQCAAGGVAIVGVGVGIGVAGGSHGGAGAFALMLPAGVAGVTTEEIPKDGVIKTPISE